jgi:phage gp46-like protein
VLGSRLWELRRLGAAEALRRAAALAEEALAWLVTDKVASRVTATAVALAGRADVLLLSVDIYRPQQVAPQWRGSWEVQLGL